ncbi:MAG: deaminase [Candidatus Pacearchaeota archaeon]|nr:deaminase [Candidatus Pacearchaeota archaeon]
MKDDSIISTGYNGPVRGAPNCLDYGCLKNENKKEAGKGYDFCRAGPMHAEVNAIVNAARNNGGTLGSIIYIAGEFSGDRTGLSDSYPCKGCQKAIINAGIEKVVIRMADGTTEKFLIETWIEEAKSTKDKDIKGFY